MDNKVTIYGKSGGELLKIDVDDNSYRYRAIMNTHTVTLYYSLAEHVEIPVGSYIIYQAARYTLWAPENFKKHSTRNFEYTVEFGDNTELLKLYKYKDLSEIPYRVKFPLTAKPATFLKLLVDNMNLRDSGWRVGACIDASEKAISFSHEYCYDVLGRFASEWGTEWEIEDKTINLRKVEKFKSSPLPLSYGKGNGIKPGTGRANQGDKKPVSLLYVQGGERNIDYSKYKSKSLLLPKSQELEYEGRRYVTDEHGMYIMRADRVTDTIVEDSYDASDIYPKRVGVVTSVEVVDTEKKFYDFVDSSIPDELNFNDCLIAGETMTVIFQSGMLAGSDKEFEVKYFHDPILDKDGNIKKKGRRFEIVPQEIDGMMMPNEVYCPKSTDTYAVFNVSLPDAYICNNSDKSGASWDMFRDAARYLYEHEEVEFSFSGTLDGIWSKKKWLEIGGRILPGAYIRFSDLQFQPDGIDIRITGVKDYINKPYSPEIELSNTPVAGYVSSELGKIDAGEVINEGNHKGALQFTKRRFRDAMETFGMLENAFLNFSTSIDPIAVRTMQLLVGDESLQFRFVTSKTNPVVISYNITYDTKKKVLKAPAAILQHMTMGIDTITASHKVGDYKFWDMAEYNSPPLVDATKKYYMYAKVSKDNGSGAFLLSETAIKLEGIAGYYHLLVGVLNSEYEGERSFVELYGFTEILPGRITTDLIVSSDGKTYFSLNQGEIGGNIKIKSGSSGLENLEEWAEVSKDISAANESANKANDAVENLNKYVDEAFRDGIITEAEAKAIEKYINVVKSTKADMEATYTKLYSNAYLVGAPKTNLLNAKVTFMGAVDDLLNAINSAISDGKTTAAEKQNVDAKYAAFNTAYSSMSQAIEAAYKAIQDMLKGYSDEALKAAQDAAKAASDAANSAGEANKAISNLGNYVDGAFADGVIKESEAKAIEKYINTVNSTKSAVEATYNKLYTNAYLSGTPKTNLLNAKVTLFGAISNLTSSINSAISDGKTTAEEKRDVDSKFTAFNSAYASFNTAVEAAYKAIQDMLKGYSDENSAELRVLSNQISAEVTRLNNLSDGYEQFKSEINQRADNLSLSVSSGTGKILYKDIEFKIGTNGTNVYSNSDTKIDYERVPKSENCPTESDYMMKLTYTHGTDITPGLGGFYFATPTRANAAFETHILAKIPVGYTIEFATNAYGNNSYYKWLTSNKGTGKWEKYICRVQCGTSGEFSTTNFFYLSGTTPEFSYSVDGSVWLNYYFSSAVWVRKRSVLGSWFPSVKIAEQPNYNKLIWYVGAATVYDLLANEDLISQINLTPEKIKIKSSKLELEGLTTINEKFKVLEDGSVEAVDGKFTGILNAGAGSKIGGMTLRETYTIGISAEFQQVPMSGLWYPRIIMDNYKKYQVFGLRTDGVGSGIDLPNKATVKADFGSDDLTFDITIIILSSTVSSSSFYISPYGYYTYKDTYIRDSNGNVFNNVPGNNPYDMGCLYLKRGNIVTIRYVMGDYYLVSKIF